MKTNLKTLAVIGALTVGGLFATQGAFAQADQSDTMRMGPGAGYADCQGYGRGNGMGPGGHHRGGWGMGAGRIDSNRNLTIEQVKTLVEAHLIRMGNENLKLGKIAETKNNSYNVQIVTKDNSLVDTLEISKATGFPVR